MFKFNNTKKKQQNTKPTLMLLYLELAPEFDDKL